MKFSAGAIAILAAAITSNPFPDEAFAQSLPKQELQLEETASIQHLANAKSQDRAKPNLPLLAKTVVNFFQHNRYQTDSAMILLGKAPGITVTVNVKIKTIVQSPNQFRAELLFVDPNTRKESRYLLVCDGHQLWTYSPTLAHYSVTSFEDFDRSNNTFWIGFSSKIFLSGAKEIDKLIQAGEFSERNLLNFLEQSFLSGEIPLKSGGLKTIDGLTYYLYQYNDFKEGFQVIGFIDPNTAAVKQLRIAGRYKGMDLVMAEQIQHRVEIPSLTTDLFTFSPPPGAIEVRSVPLGPF